MGRRLTPWLVVTLLLGCSRRDHATASASNDPANHGSAAPAVASSAAGDTAQTGSYYTFKPDDALERMSVEVCFRGQVPKRLGVPMGSAAPFMRGAQRVGNARDGGALAIGDDGVRLDGVAPGSCVAYTIDTAAILDDADAWDGKGRLDDDAMLSPDYWLWPPEPRTAPVYARFESARWQPAVSWPQRPGSHAYPLRVPDSAFMWKTQAAFGRFEAKTLTIGRATLGVVPLGDGFGAREQTVMRWLRTSAEAVAALLGRFPVDCALVLLAGDAARKGSFGFTVRGGGPTATLLLPATVSEAQLANDWTAVHELLHFALPPLPTEDAWLYEGVVTYLTAVARARAGIISADEAWWELLDGFRRGRKVGTGVTLRQEARAMHKNRAYWRVYWAGAAMALKMDLELHRRDKTLAETVAALARSDPDSAKRWKGAEVMKRLDGHCDSDIPTKTMDAHVDAKAFPDTRALAGTLGVKLGPRAKDRGRANVIYDDSAPDAAIRRAIMRRGAAAQ